MGKPEIYYPKCLLEGHIKPKSIERKKEAILNYLIANNPGKLISYQKVISELELNLSTLESKQILNTFILDGLIIEIEGLVKLSDEGIDHASYSTWMK